MFDTNRKGNALSSQISEMGVIDISSSDFTLDVEPMEFNLKNDNEDSVTLQVKLAAQTSDDWISTVFQPGWNPEILKAVKTNASVSNLKWGN